jgi:hypothetical protein
MILEGATPFKPTNFNAEVDKRKLVELPRLERVILEGSNPSFGTNFNGL